MFDPSIAFDKDYIIYLYFIIYLNLRNLSRKILFSYPRVKMFDPSIAFDKDYMVFVAPKPGLFPK